VITLVKLLTTHEPSSNNPNTIRNLKNPPNIIPPTAILELPQDQYNALLAVSMYMVWHGRQTHQTGGSKGCYGTDPNDPIYEASCSNCCYVFYSGTGCTGNVVGPGRACNTAKYPDVDLYGPADRSNSGIHGILPYIVLENVSVDFDLAARIVTNTPDLDNIHPTSTILQQFQDANRGKSIFESPLRQYMS
ncbi:5214_t:CDS:2, partial [Gigaspora rosea]